MKKEEMISKLNLPAIEADLNSYLGNIYITAHFEQPIGLVLKVHNFNGVVFAMRYAAQSTYVEVYARFLPEFNGSTEACHSLANILAELVNGKVKFVQAVGQLRLIERALVGAAFYDIHGGVCPDLNKILLPMEFDNWIIKD